jgi:hypothetical protein
MRVWPYSEKITEAAKRILPDAEVYVFGRVVRGEAVGGSYVDILIRSDMIPKNNIERTELKLKIEELAGLPPFHPFEIHLANSEEMSLYSRIKELTKIE